MFKRSQQIHLLSHMNPQNFQIKRMLLDIEGQLKFLIPLISQMMSIEVFKNITQSGDLDLILYPLLNSIEISSSQSSASSQFALSQTSSLSSNQSEPCDASNFAKIEAEDFSQQQDQPQQLEQQIAAQQAISMLLMQSQNKSIDQFSSNLPTMVFKPQDLKLYENILLFVDQCLLLLQQQQPIQISNPSHTTFSSNLVPPTPSSFPQQQQDKNLKSNVDIQNENMNNTYTNIHTLPNISRNEYQKIMLSKLTSLHFPDVLRTILNILQSKYSKLQSQGILSRLPSESLESLKQFIPIVQLSQKLLYCFANPQISGNSKMCQPQATFVNTGINNFKKVDDCMIKTEDTEESLDNDHEITRTSSPTSSSLKSHHLPLRV